MKMDGVTVQTRYIVKRKGSSKHPSWWVVDSSSDSLICVCSYLKGAESLIERLCALDRIIAHLIQRNVLEALSDASNGVLTIKA